MPRTGPPVVIVDGSFRIEVDEPVDLDAKSCDLTSMRPFAYMGRSDNNIRYVVVKRNGEQIWSEEFNPKECQIEIYWEKPQTASNGGKMPSKTAE
ncbi:MAG: hypothetical protein WKF30_08360 [Pyrinomonadaceae bacterium]